MSLLVHTFASESGFDGKGVTVTWDSEMDDMVEFLRDNTEIPNCVSRVCSSIDSIKDGVECPL
jgi:hypothetical protein